MEKIEYGNAMIKVEERKYSDPDEFESVLREALAPRKQSFEDILDDIEARLSAFLEERDCPHPNKLCVFLGAHWCALPDDFERMSYAKKRTSIRNAAFGLGVAFVRKNFQPTDPEAIAATICLRIFEYRKLRIEEKLKAAFHIGRHYELFSSLRHLEMVERGKSNHESTRRGGKNSKKTDDIKRSLAVMAEYRKRHSIKRSAELAARDLGLKPSTMLSRWYRAQKQARHSKKLLQN